MKTTVDVSMVTLDPRAKATHPDLATSLASFRLETDVINTEPNSWRKKGSCGGEERIKGVTEKGRGGADVGEDRMMALTEKLGRRSSLWTSQTLSVVCLCGIRCNWSKAHSEQRIRQKKEEKTGKRKKGRGGKYKELLK